MIKKLYALIAVATNLISTAQNPGLVISEILANPAGTDSCKEYVELIATQNINFSLTPYTIIVNNNGSANSNGWVAGGSLSYAFSINSGSISAGSVAYVGGSCMTPTASQLRTLNVKYLNGDWNIGTANTAGVFGNGGSNADGVAVFNLPVSSITATTVPVDALFFGTGIGTASVNAGIDGYQLPVNDFYSGGKLVGTSFLAPDPGSDLIITCSGIYNLAANSWSVNRSISTGTVASDGVSSVSLSTSGTVTPAQFSFVSNDTTVNESFASATVYFRVSTASSATSAISVYATAYSNATASDYTLGSSTFTFAANAPVNTTAALTFSISNDVVTESTEYIILRFYNLQNASIGTNQQFAFYIADNDKPIPAASNALTLSLLSSFSNTVAGSNSAEIVVHDPGTQRLFIANSIGGKLDIVDFANPSSPALLYSIPITTYGNINSVAVKNGTVACAIEGTNPQDSGKVVFFNPDGLFLSQVKVGMMPDMITFNNAGTRVLTANEGEPNSTYTLDPDGSVSIINISGGVSNLTASNVAHITFTAYNGQETALRASGIRIFGLNASASKDFEPEYISISKDDSKAWVTLQENNAILEISLLTNSITSLRALGTKDHNLLNNGMDVSNTTKGINISNFAVKGFYLPDAIASYTVGGINYLVTANEGDTRDYPSGGYTEEVRLGSAALDPVKFPFASQMKNNSVLGRLILTNKNGDIDNDGDLDTLYSIGARSFSIWNANTGNLVYDSKDDMELITANSSYSVIFNASNTNITRKDRSDDKGPEPEGVAIGQIGSNTYAFIAIERIGGVMVYDISNPAAPVFVTYVNNRNTSALTGDRGAEGVIFIPQSQSPNGQHILIAANEVSSSLSIWGIPGCTSPLASSLSVTGSTLNACSNSPLILSVPSNTTASYVWSVNGNTISGAVSNTYAANASGNYSVSISTNTNCFTGSVVKSLTINPSPTLIVPGSSSVCSGSAITLSVTGASTYSWNVGPTSSVVTFTPASTQIYTVTGTSSASCTSVAFATVVVQPTPQLTISPTSMSVCAGQSSTITASGAATYSWNNGNTLASFSLSPTTSTLLTVVAGSTANCTASGSVSITVNPVPVININTPSTLICMGNTLTAIASGANSYTWNTGSTNSVLIANPISSVIYTVTGSSLNCLSTKTVGFAVYMNPIVGITGNTNVCLGSSVTLTATGANTFTWSNGATASTITVSPSGFTTYSVTGAFASTGCSNTISVTMNTLASPVLSAATAPTICAGEQATLSVGGASSYTWAHGASGAIITVSPLSTTVYTVNGTNSAGCSASLNVTQNVASCLGLLQDPNLVMHPILFPNPAKESVSVEWQGATEIKVRITDAAGAVIYNSRVTGDKINIDVSKYAMGIYFISLTSGELSNTKKLIID